MTTTRRDALKAAALAPALGMMSALPGYAGDPPTPRRRNRIGVSSYSFWQFRNNDLRDLETCIDRAADMGFDGIEILHRQMTREDNDYLQRLKRRAFSHGLDLIGFSTHQGFLSPDRAIRRKNIDHTIRCIELSYALGIPTMRVNTGTWGTSKNFDELMKNRGIEPPLEGHNDEEGFRWVIDSLTECLRAAERCGVVLGLENHWGLGRTAAGVMRVVEAVNSPCCKLRSIPGIFSTICTPKWNASRRGPSSCRPRCTMAAASGTRSTWTTLASPES